MNIVIDGQTFNFLKYSTIEMTPLVTQQLCKLCEIPLNKVHTYYGLNATANDLLFADPSVFNRLRVCYKCLEQFEAKSAEIVFSLRIGLL